MRNLARNTQITTRTNVRVNAIIRGRASTASVATLAKNGVEQAGFPCRAASKSGEYPHRKNRAFRLTAETLCFHFGDSPKPLNAQSMFSFKQNNVLCHSVYLPFGNERNHKSEDSNNRLSPTDRFLGTHDVGQRGARPHSLVHQCT